MQPAELQPPMPRIKRWCFTALFATAITLTCLAYFRGVVTPDRATNVFVGFISALYITTIVEFLPELVRLVTERSARRRFARFVGASPAPVHLVFISRQLRAQTPAGAAAANPFVMQYKQETLPTRCAIPTDVSHWLAFQDLRAAVYIGNAVFAKTGRRNLFATDSDLKQIAGDTSVSVGFTNDYTLLLRKYFSDELFSWNIDKGDPTKDTISLLGQPVALPPDSVALVARLVLPVASDATPHVAFVVAGLGAQGTAVAGWFLANKWEKLYKLYADAKKDLFKDSLAVGLQYTPLTNAQQTIDETGRIASPDGKELVAWKRASGIE